MAFLEIPNIEIKGISACVPERIVRNRDYAYLEKEEIEKYISTIGVEEKHCAVPDGSICTSDLCYKSADKLISDLGWKREEIEALIFVSHTADYKLPSTSCILQDRLRLSTSCLAFDVPLGCSGFVYGLSIISSILFSGKIKKGLLLVGNTQSFYAGPKDQSTSLLFGDAGCAIALELNEKNRSKFFFNLYSDGSGKDALVILDGGCRHPFSERSLVEYSDENGTRTPLHEKMDGLEVFAFATRKVPSSIKELINHFSLDKSKIDYLLLHQANRFLCEKIRKKLDFTEETTPYNINKFGNTSGASIPLLMVTDLQEQLKSQELTFLACGFGVGLSLGSSCFTTNKICCPDLLYL